HFQGEKAVPGTANLPIGAIKSLTPKEREPKPFSRHKTRTKDLFSVLDGCFQVDRDASRHAQYGTSFLFQDPYLLFSRKKLTRPELDSP
ncbi:MAG TPA: hypothetical protein PKH31_16300, partial [Candidatus Sumerlaeota bacterium]|nr:hypothetical protein [Candidatus Sumerlaeota bacterium]